MRPPLIAALILGAAGVAVHAADTVAAASPRVYLFEVFLDDKPIGEHRFTVVVDGDRRSVTSEADFSVKLFGITAYRYHHHADEQWVGDCLIGLVSRTDDDGKPASVTLVKTGDANEITTAAGKRSEPGCLMTYAYWNPALREQKRLLDPQTGELRAVTVEGVGGGRIALGGKDVAATDWRISGGVSPIDVRVSEQGDWIGLDSLVSHGRHRLSYRLR